MNPGHGIRHEARRAVHRTAPWVERLARMGYAAKGSIYIVIGLLALRSALGQGGRATDSRGAIQEIGTQPYGQLLLWALALGLVGYALWQAVRATLDPEHKGHSPTGLAKRIGYAVSAVVYVGLALTSLRLALGQGGGGGGQAEEDWTARLMSEPFGQVLVGAAGAAIIAFALFQFVLAYNAKFMDKLDLSGRQARRHDWVERLGRAGISARGVVLAVVGIFLVQAALYYEPERAGGLSEALRELAHQPFGPWLLGAVAAGLAAYGLFAWAQAAYRHLRVD
ncbi:hypothetical protein HNR42_002516 [Deinobacterium chartae]|uniref:DUF1206 domain-containing protein n=1 Tax=Deinobacterium chartae TaxID=521158 RepID=A0A841I3T9_9DEIO|nr:DUF1206 domain-containing protein [Deinobacterium chartae]MBB6099080.1 hypothetical protein [Deinobacterium chartae]